MKFKREIDEELNIRMTFNQQKAYDNHKLMFVNIYHPIIQACLNYFEKKNDKTKTSFCYALTEDSMLTAGDSYYLVVYQISVSRKILGITKHTETLLPLLYHNQTNTVVKDEDIINHVFSRSQTEGLEHNANNDDVDSEMLQDMRYDFAEALSQEKTKRMSELRLQIESDRHRNEQQTKEYYASVIENQKRFIRNWESEIEMVWESDDKRVRQLEGVIRLTQNRINQYRKEEQERLEQINEASQIEVTEDVISLNLINII